MSVFNPLTAKGVKDIRKVPLETRYLSTGSIPKGYLRSASDISIVTPTAMTVRCVQCGQENNPQYRFCGMCGAPLGPPPAVREEAGHERSRVPLSGPSFLGLGDDRSRDLDYLLEDEPPRGHGRLYLALLLLVLCGALLAWHWQRDGYPWAGLIRRQTASSAPANSVAQPIPDAAPASAPGIPVEPTANPAPPEGQPAAAAEDLQPGATEPAAGSAASPIASATAKSPDQTSPSDDGSASPSAGDATAPPAAPSQTTEPETAAEPAPKQAKAATAVPVAKPASPKPSPTAPATSFEDRLVADGERYLYGRGVPEDCARAQRNLQIAARQSNAKAQTLLGAMYATGHCVNRDLPTSYRWFAKALHADPGNSRVQRDLEVLWKQMTPEERQLAMRSQ